MWISDVLRKSSISLKFILIILIFFPLTVSAQFEFEPDSISPIETQLGIPNPDSIKFELRLWNNSQNFSLFTQLSYTQNNEWNYHTGLINHDEVLYYFENNPDIDLAKLWETLDSLGVRSLPSQEIATASLEKNGSLHKLTFEEFEKLTQLSDGSMILVELFNKKNYRSYHFFNPTEISNGFKNSKQNWIAEEHFAMAMIIQTINKRLELTQAFKRFVEKVGNKY